MSIYHCSIKIIGRSQGRSAIASAAYRSGSNLHSNETDKNFNYSNKHGVAHSEVMLCKNAPAEYADRETLWNAVQAIEKNGNAQLAREVEVALPNELSRIEQINCVRDYVQKNFVDKGMCADWSLHDKEDGNPHAHIMLTTRPIKENGSWGDKKKNGYKLDANGNKIPKIDPKTGEQKIEKKTGRKVWERQTVESTDWNNKDKAEEWRKAWAEECNKYLEAEKKIDHRSYERQGKDQIPTIHEGAAAQKIEKTGAVADRCDLNRQIKAANYEIKKLEVYHGITGSLTGIRSIRSEIQAENNREAERDPEEEKRITSIKERIRSLIDGIRGRITSVIRQNPLVTAQNAPESVLSKKVVESTPEKVKPLKNDFKDISNLFGDLPEETVIIKDGSLQVKNPVDGDYFVLGSGWNLKQAKDSFRPHEHKYESAYQTYKKPMKLRSEIQEKEAELNSMGFLSKGKKDLKEQIESLKRGLPQAEKEAKIAEIWLKKHKGIVQTASILESKTLEQYIFKTNSVLDKLRVKEKEFERQHTKPKEQIRSRDRSGFTR